MTKNDAIQLIVAATLVGSLEDQKKRIGSVLDAYIISCSRQSIKGIMMPIDKRLIDEKLFNNSNIYYMVDSTSHKWCMTYKEFLLKKDKYTDWLIKY